MKKRKQMKKKKQEKTQRKKTIIQEANIKQKTIQDILNLIIFKLSINEKPKHYN